MISTLTINGKIIGSGYLTHILSVDGMASPVVQNSMYYLSGAHGARVPNSFWRERVITLDLLITGTNMTTYVAERNDVIEAFGLPRSGPQNLEIETKDGRDLMVENVQLRNMTGPFDDSSCVSGSLRVELVSGDTYITGQTENSETLYLATGVGVGIPTVVPLSLAYTSGGHEFITITGNGTYYPIITITGPVTNPIIKNYTTNLELQIEDVFDGNDVLVIDMANQTVVLNDNYDYLDYTDGDFWALVPGSNDVGLSSATYDANANAVITWRESYLGI